MQPFPPLCKPHPSHGARHNLCPADSGEDVRLVLWTWKWGSCAWKGKWHFRIPVFPTTDICCATPGCRLHRESTRPKRYTTPVYSRRMKHRLCSIPTYPGRNPRMVLVCVCFYWVFSLDSGICSIRSMWCAKWEANWHIAGDGSRSDELKPGRWL